MTRRSRASRIVSSRLLWTFRTYQTRTGGGSSSWSGPAAAGGPSAWPGPGRGAVAPPSGVCSSTSGRGRPAAVGGRLVGQSGSRRSGDSCGAAARERRSVGRMTRAAPTRGKGLGSARVSLSRWSRGPRRRTPGCGRTAASSTRGSRRRRGRPRPARPSPGRPPVARFRSSRLVQETLFISASVAIRKSANGGYCSSRQISQPRPARGPPGRRSRRRPAGSPSGSS